MSDPLPYCYFINDDVHWNSFFIQLFGRAAPRLTFVELDSNNPIVLGEFKKLNATVIIGEMINGARYINGAAFETKEDYLFFKLKFN